jgi:hypothetical protein
LPGEHFGRRSAQIHQLLSSGLLLLTTKIFLAGRPAFLFSRGSADPLLFTTKLGFGENKPT